jgi:hypothetical protein
MHDRSNRPFVLDVTLGAAAGAAGTWLMDRATTSLYERENAAAKKRENAARGDRTAYEIAAEKGAKLVHRELDDQGRKRVGAAIHWALGTGAGVTYALLRRRGGPLARLGSGLVFGLAFWLLMDEIALTAAKLTPPPGVFPWQAHARGVAGHLVLGGAVESVFDAADAVLH